MKKGSNKIKLTRIWPFSTFTLHVPKDHVTLRQYALSNDNELYKNKVLSSFSMRRTDLMGSIVCLLTQSGTALKRGRPYRASEQEAEASKPLIIH